MSDIYEDKCGPNKFPPHVKDTCTLFAKYENTHDYSEVEDLLVDLPTLLPFPEINNAYLEEKKDELQKAIKHEEDYDIDRLVNLILFLTYAQYILTLIDSCDSKAGSFIGSSDQAKLSVCRGRVRLWKLLIPPSNVIKNCLLEVDSKKYDVVLRKVLKDSKEREIISKMVGKYVLVEIVDTYEDCDEMTVTYSFAEESVINQMSCTDTEIFLFFDRDCQSLVLKNDPRDTVRKILLGAPKILQGVQHNICLDMSVILLYVAIVISKCIGVDLLKMMTEYNLLNDSVRDRLTKK